MMTQICLQEQYEDLTLVNKPAYEEHSKTLNL